MTQQPKSKLQASVSILYALLQECMRKKDISGGRRVHALIIRNGFQGNSVLGYHLIIMFASFGRLQEACDVFYNLPQPSTHAWAAIISSHLQQGQPHQAIHIYFQMKASKNLIPNLQIYVSVLKACASTNALTQGRLIHRHIVESRKESSVVVASTLIHMYARCGSLEEAVRVFDGVDTPNAVLWTVMMAAYALHSRARDALELFQRMQEQSLRPNAVTFVTCLKACVNVGDLERGSIIHAQIINDGFESSLVVANTLIDMYVRFGNVQEARKVFEKLPERDVISWTAMLWGYAKHGFFVDSLHLFVQMQQEGFKPNKVTFLCFFKVCTGLAALKLGEVVHSDMIRSGTEVDVVIGSALIDMYSKCGRISEAVKVFYDLPSQNVVSWTAIVSGHAHQALGEEALQYFNRMQHNGIHPNSVTFLSVLKACATLAALSEGRKVHNQIKEIGLQSSVPISNALIDMYSCCAELKEARIVFDGMPRRDVVSWTAMISGYAQQGIACEAFRLFESMQQDGQIPNKITYISMLTACSYNGLLSEAYELLRSMSRIHHITPQLEHYVCMVDVLGRAGNLCEVEKLINCMPVKPNATIWMSVLGACRTHGNVEFGRRSFESIIKLEPTNKAAYILMSNIYAASKGWADRADIVRRFEGWDA